ncbi:hypothetical protein UFOVP154_40 [uncultured Caudovirales phage]|uniref:Uncharacterized protein n=1 Tax=uncultured Caudovirales phage TaxID=2100421 RepID=A0A6J7W9Y2_9CAUD|nr:hypothetical protein UFOVP8_25 [uncultured Caudovirales phage]CAB5170680.1 hypothetical protein UFOVP154_40 [uncultured Caudovirales phage]
MSTSTDETFRRSLAQRQIQLKSQIEGMLAHPIEELQAELDDITKLLDGTDWSAPVTAALVTAAEPKAAQVAVERAAAEDVRAEKLRAAPVSLTPSKE